MNQKVYSKDASLEDRIINDLSNLLTIRHFKNQNKRISLLQRALQNFWSLKENEFFLNIRYDFISKLIETLTLLGLFYLIFSSTGDNLNKNGTLLSGVLYSQITIFILNEITDVFFEFKYNSHADTIVSSFFNNLNINNNSDPNLEQSTQDSTINFTDVSFSFPQSNKLILKNISFNIKQNETIAIVGKSGSGNLQLLNYWLKNNL